MVAGGGDPLSLPAVDVAPPRCAPARCARAIRLLPSARAAHAVGLDRPTPRSTAAAADLSGAAVHCARRAAGGISLGTDQPPRQRNRFRSRYLAQHVDTGCKARSPDARQTRHRRFHPGAGRRRGGAGGLRGQRFPGLPHYPRLWRIPRVFECHRHQYHSSRRHQHRKRHSRGAGCAAAASRQRQDLDPGHRRRGLGRRCAGRRPDCGASGRTEDLYRRRGDTAGRSRAGVGGPARRLREGRIGRLRQIAARRTRAQGDCRRHGRNLCSARQPR